MVIDKKFDGLKAEPKQYILNHNVEAMGSVRIHLNKPLTVNGSIIAGGSIHCKTSLKVRGFVKAKGHLTVQGQFNARGLEVDGPIKISVFPI